MKKYWAVPVFAVVAAGINCRDSPAPQPPGPPPSRPPYVTAIDLGSNPELFDGREIDLSARFLAAEGVVVNLHGLFTRDEWGEGGEQIWIVSPGEEVLLRSPHPDPIEERFNSALRNQWSCHAIVRGKFSVLPTRTGHMNCCRYRFEVLRVLSAEVPFPPSTEAIPLTAR